MPAAIALVLSGLLLIVPDSTPLPLDSPCPEIFRYEQVSEGTWRANLTLISESDLEGVWVRLLTKPKLEEVVVSDEFEVRYNGTEEVRLANRKFHLEAAVPTSLTVSGKLINGELPELISVILNGKLICSSEQISGSTLYNGDFNNKKYLSTIKTTTTNIQNTSTSNNTKCGKALLLNSLIPNDNIKVLPGEWPWQAGIFKDVNGSQTLLCEATLISEDTLLTSAHCVTWQESNLPVTASLLSARLKNLNVQEANEDDIYKVKTVIVHPDFDEKSLKNDVAIVKLLSGPGLDEAVQPICLPSSGKLPEGSFVLGYGFKEDGTLLNLGVAKAVPLADNQCSSLEPSYGPLINDDNYCATYVQGHEICIGSSGSGVMDVKSDSEYTWELRGVVSVGRALHEKFRCDQNSPILIADVSKYLKWIKSNIS
ncbi:phenoloxidase-activating factor 3-like [Harmonia axyridis]|uniref:phenoloxidase-activating factor 3-like n=1 Tax=Harmonia axyridis TaxID=115357 RepID=UPI001E2798DB|nr:phenoloxidase-activating factor 3-like [Harmonia axyridis]